MQRQRVSDNGDRSGPVFFLHILQHGECHNAAFSKASAVKFSKEISVNNTIVVRVDNTGVMN